MRILLLGGAGFIGRHILAELLGTGHELVCVVRSTGELQSNFPAVRFVEMDLAGATSAEGWLPCLKGIDCIVNAAGLLRGAHMEAVHVKMPKALYDAAARSGLRHVVLISAISARSDVATDYSQSKLAGEQVLRASSLAWTVLRPSLVYGDGSYGGTSLIRGMAGLPLITPLPGDGDFAFSPIHAADLARGVAALCGNSEYFGETLEPAGPETLSLKAILGRYRAWLGFGQARFLGVPMPVMRFFSRLGDAAGDGPISSNSLAQMVAGNGGDGATYAKAIGFRQRSLDDWMRGHPSLVQDRWHARLFFLAPLIKASLIFLWLASGLLGLLHGEQMARDFVLNAGLPAGLASPLRLFSSATDIGIAALVLLDRRARWATVAQFAAVGGYTVVLGLVQPTLWLDPFGPLLKNLPILLLVAVYSVLGDKR